MGKYSHIEQNFIIFYLFIFFYENIKMIVSLKYFSTIGGRLVLFIFG